MAEQTSIGIYHYDFRNDSCLDARIITLFKESVKESPAIIIDKVIYVYKIRKPFFE